LQFGILIIYKGRMLNMAGQIRITPTQLKTEAGKLDGLAQQHDEVFNKMKVLVENLSQQWEGQAMDAFKGSFKTAEVELKKFRENINVFTSRMKTAAQKLDETDTALKNAFK
jgi:WXG100 family type VII secretion target